MTDTTAVNVSFMSLKLCASMFTAGIRRRTERISSVSSAHRHQVPEYNETNVHSSKTEKVPKT